MVIQRFHYSSSILKSSHFFAVTGSMLAVILCSVLLLEQPGLSELDYSQLHLDENGDIDFEVQLFKRRLAGSSSGFWPHL